MEEEEAAAVQAVLPVPETQDVLLSSDLDLQLEHQEQLLLQEQEQEQEQEQAETKQAEEEEQPFFAAAAAAAADADATSAASAETQAMSENDRECKDSSSSAVAAAGDTAVASADSMVPVPGGSESSKLLDSTEAKNSGPTVAGADKDKKRDLPDGFRFKRSRIPFDVTSMNYQQYCHKHYEWAIENYFTQRNSMGPHPPGYFPPAGMMPPPIPPGPPPQYAPFQPQYGMIPGPAMAFPMTAGPVGYYPPPM